MLKGLVTNVRKPTDDYIRTQNKLCTILKKTREEIQADQGINVIRCLRDNLEAEFMETFPLRPINSTRAWNVEEDLCRYAGASNLFDHTKHYIYINTFVFVAQPYTLIEDTVLELLASLRIEVVELNDWAFYFPNWARCYGVVFGTGSIQLLKALKANDFGMGAARIFPTALAPGVDNC